MSGSSLTQYSKIISSINIPEANIMSTTDSIEDKGLFLVPSRNVINRNPDISGFIVSAGNSEGKLQFTDVNGLISLEQLSDVIITNPQLDQVLTYNGFDWVNQTPTGGGVTVPGQGAIWFSDTTGSPIGDNTKFSWLSTQQVLQLEGSIEFTTANGFFTISQSPTQLGDLSLVLPSTAGTSGYVLTTDGNGVTSWTSKGTGGLPDGDYGDITVSNFGSTWIINNESVTLQKIQNSDTAKILGRNSSGNGSLEFINRVSSLEIIDGTEEEIRGMSPSDIKSFVTLGVNDYLSKTDVNLQTIVSPIQLLDTSQSISTTSGSLVVDGGVGINLDVFIGGEVNSTAYNTTSDKRKKKDIKMVENPMGILSGIGAYSYILKNDTKCKKHYGVLAQELIGTELEQSVSHLEDGSMTVNYTDIIGVLIGAVNELSNKVNKLENIIEKYN